MPHESRELHLQIARIGVNCANLQSKQSAQKGRQGATGEPRESTMGGGPCSFLFYDSGDSDDSGDSTPFSGRSEEEKKEQQGGGLRGRLSEDADDLLVVGTPRRRSVSR